MHDQKRSTKPLLTRLEQLIKTHRGPVLMLGDFNTWTTRKTANVHRMAERAGLKVVPFDASYGLLTGQLDWAFVRGVELVPGSVDVVLSDMGEPLYSDHPAISFTLRYE